MSTLQFVYLFNSRKKWKCLKFKVPYLGIFVLNLKKNYSRIWNKHSQICQFCKFWGKSKNAWILDQKCFRYFWDTSLKNCCHIWNHHPQIFPFANFFKKIKMHKFANKIASFEYLCARILKKLWSYLKSPPSSLYVCKFSGNIKNV